MNHNCRQINRKKGVLLLCLTMCFMLGVANVIWCVRYVYWNVINTLILRKHLFTIPDHIKSNKQLNYVQL